MSRTAHWNCGRNWRQLPKAVRRFGCARWNGAVADPMRSTSTCNSVPLLDTSGEVLGVSISFTDVTRFRQLRVEVETANRQLELAYEELQSTNEELQSSNEELQSSLNEELQSSTKSSRARTKSSRPREKSCSRRTRNSSPRSTTNCAIGLLRSPTSMPSRSPS